MGVKDFDNIIKTVIASALVGLFVWMFNINADVKVQANEITHIKKTVSEAVEVNKELVDVVVELRIAVEKLNNK